MERKIGQLAPDFSLPDQNGNAHKLSDYAGQWVVLYFYPQDDTPGCTTEACAMRDNLLDLQKLDAVVLGVSVDSVESHKQFADKNQLNFTILADKDKQVVNQYGVWGDHQMPSGQTFTGTMRSTFLINPEGEIAKIYEQVDPETHVEEVIKDLQFFKQD